MHQADSFWSIPISPMRFEYLCCADATSLKSSFNFFLFLNFSTQYKLVFYINEILRNHFLHCFWIEIWNCMFKIIHWCPVLSPVKVTRKVVFIDWRKSCLLMENVVDSWSVFIFLFWIFIFLFHLKYLSIEITSWSTCISMTSFILKKEWLFIFNCDMPEKTPRERMNTRSFAWNGEVVSWLRSAYRCWKRILCFLSLVDAFVDEVIDSPFSDWKLLLYPSLAQQFFALCLGTKFEMLILATSLSCFQTVSLKNFLTYHHSKTFSGKIKSQDMILLLFPFRWSLKGNTKIVISTIATKIMN